MGHSRMRPGRDGKPRYTAYFEDIAGHHRSAGTFASKRAADRAWQAAETKVREGRMGDPSRGRQLLRRYVLADWLPNHEMEARTRETYTYYIHRYVLPTFGDMKLVEIMPIDVRRWVVALKADGLSPANLKQCHTILSAIFHDGAE